MRKFSKKDLDEGEIETIMENSFWDRQQIIKLYSKFMVNLIDSFLGFKLISQFILINSHVIIQAK